MIINTERKNDMIRMFGITALIALTTCLGCKDSKKKKPDAGLETVVGIGVSDKNARSCEVLILENGAEVTGIKQDATLKGAYVRQQPNTAVTFTALADESIGEGAIGIVTVGDESGTVEVTKATCFDSKGAVLKGATVELLL